MALSTSSALPFSFSPPSSFARIPFSAQRTPLLFSPLFPPAAIATRRHYFVAHDGRSANVSSNWSPLPSHRMHLCSLRCTFFAFASLESIGHSLFPSRVLRRVVYCPLDPFFPTLPLFGILKVLDTFPSSNSNFDDFVLFVVFKLRWSFLSICASFPPSSD